jgi:hypothetical protein
MAFCVMVKGPCRGKMCDFWARVRIRKSTLEELVIAIQESIAECQSENSLSFDEATREYWDNIGVRSLLRLREEEPDLYEKMKQAEVIAHGDFVE